MLIKELEPGTEVSIESSNTEAKINLKTRIATVTAPEDQAVLQQIGKERKIVYTVLEPIREEEKLINFLSPNVKNSLVYIKEGKPYIWEGIGILNWRLPVLGSVHIVTSTRNAVSYNRRQHFRIWLGCDGSVKVQGDEKIRGVIVKDLSEGGVAFIVRDITGLEKGYVCDVSFTDASSGSSFVIPSVIIRIEEMEDGRYTVGCRLKNFSEPVARFINTKQKERMKTGKK